MGHVGGEGRELHFELVNLGDRYCTSKWKSKIGSWVYTSLEFRRKVQTRDVTWKTSAFIFLKDLFIYLFMRDTERNREAETQAEGDSEGEAGSTQGA